MVDIIEYKHNRLLFQMKIQTFVKHYKTVDFWRESLAYTKQLTCQTFIRKKEHAEKTGTAGNHDPQEFLMDSLDKLSAEINNLLKEHPQSNEVLTDISRETADAYEKLTVIYEKFKNTRR